MAKYRRKPGLPIEARQWPHDNGDLVNKRDWPEVGCDADGYYVTTIHDGQKAYLKKGDWILPEPDGEHYYPCKPDIFAKTYEPATPPLISIPDGYEFTEADLSAPGFVVYEPGDPRPILSVAEGSKFTDFVEWTPEQQAAMAEAQRDAIATGIGMVEINRIAMSDVLDVTGLDRIDTSDIPEAGEEFFRRARLTKPGDLMNWVEENLPKPETLEQAIAERNAWCETAAQHHRNEEFYHGIVTQIGEMFGAAAKTSDDGSLQDSVLALKVPELVKALFAQLEAEGAHTEAANSRIDELTAQQYRAPKAQSDG